MAKKTWFKGQKVWVYRTKGIFLKDKKTRFKGKKLVDVDFQDVEED